MEDAKVSIIMSVFNTKKEFLDCAIQSILKQTFKDFEFIIINDGSDKECLDNILYYKDSRIKIINNEINIGLTKSLNKGLTVATGKYIARMDSDDFSYPTRIEKQFEYMESHPEIDILGSWVRENDKVRKSCGSVKTEWRYARMLFDNVGIYHPTAFIRTDFMKKNNYKYNENILKAQDFELWTRCLQNGKMYVFPKVLLEYRIHEQQISCCKLNEQNYYNNIIRKSLLLKLGIELNELEENQFINMNVPVMSANEFESFSKKILMANKQYHVFKNSILKNELNTKWILHIINSERSERNSYFKKEYWYHMFSISYYWYMITIALQKCDLLKKNRETK